MHSDSIDRALRVALEAHQEQRRKDGGPYAVHPIHVGLMLARMGADEATVVAGILHDVVEDCDGWTLERVHDEFGEDVASIVAEVTEDKQRTWQERKDAAVAHVPGMSEAAVLVKAADKLHNLRTLAGTLGRAEDKGAVWSKFRGGRERTLTHAELLVEALTARVNDPMRSALTRALREVLDVG